MKKNKRNILAAIVVVFCFVLVAVLVSRYKDNSTVSTNSKIPEGQILSFSVLSDVHGETKKLDKAIRDLYSINPHSDAVILNGDIVDEGLDKDYKELWKCLKGDGKFLPNTVIENIGNHEFYDYKKGINSDNEAKQFLARYLQYSGEDKVYHDSWIKGYHFISLGSELCYTQELGPSQAYISTDQQNWLKEKLKENYKPGKPIFVFIHQTLGLNNWSSVKQDEEVRGILANYSEAIVFTSHIHSALEFANVLARQPFTVVHTGAVHRLIKPDESGKRKVVDGSEGLYIEVYSSRVVIKGRDFREKTWIDKAQNIINLK